jgi:DNA (cytosine-5)-methyltransferase 1
MSNPRLLDLFCGAGGASVGYARAGFDVTGVDVRPMLRYPFLFVQGDALEFVARNGRHFDVIHASPPCQGYTTMGNRYRGTGGTADSHPDLIGPTRALLEEIGLPYIEENVMGARKHMPRAVVLHGGMFGLGVYRPRLFESNRILLTPQKTPAPNNAIGVYGKLDGRRIWTRKDGTEQRAARTLQQAQIAMGIDWMEWPELTQAIPPAYTEYLGRQLMAVAQQRMAA